MGSFKRAICDGTRHDMEYGSWTVNLGLHLHRLARRLVRPSVDLPPAGFSQTCIRQGGGWRSDDSRSWSISL